MPFLSLAMTYAEPLASPAVHTPATAARALDARTVAASASRSAPAPPSAKLRLNDGGSCAASAASAATETSLSTPHASSASASAVKLSSPASWSAARCGAYISRMGSRLPSAMAPTLPSASAPTAMRTSPPYESPTIASSISRSEAPRRGSSSSAAASAARSLAHRAAHSRPSSPPLSASVGFCSRPAAYRSHHRSKSSRSREVATTPYLTTPPAKGTAVLKCTPAPILSASAAAAPPPSTRGAPA
mmetsp:Transcript_1323/g.3871  ORF Transcript_1323/g.3871 Transcript_1323/m.3871 type:complete len:246 (-) Transcript_1323:252-989(-)